LSAAFWTNGGRTVFLSSSASASRTRDGPLNGNRLTCPTNSIKEVELEDIFKVLSGFAARGRSLTLTPETAKQIAKEVLEGKRRTSAARTPAEVKPAACTPLFISTRAVWIKPRLEALLTKFVVDFSFLRISEHIMGEGNFLEALFSLFLAGIYIWMILSRQLTIGFFDIIVRCRATDTEHFIQVSFGHCPRLAAS
jgi:hypothetical protein